MADFDDLVPDVEFEAEGGKVPISLAGDSDPYSASSFTPYADGGNVQDFDSLQADPQQEPQNQPSQGSSQDFDSLQDDQEKYGTTGQQAIAGLEGAGQGLVGPIAPAVERAAGVNPEDIRGREEANPATHYTGEILGLALPALVTGGAGAAADLAGLTQAGLLNKIAFQGGETLAGRVGSMAAKGAVDNMLIAGSDEASKMILQDPNQSAETALTSIGLSGLIGGGLGAGLGSVSELWKGDNSSKVSQLISDFKSRIQDHIDNPDPAVAVKSELEGLYNNVKEPLAADPSVPTEDSPKLQAALDKAYDKFEPALKDIEKSFTSKVAEVPEFDLDKVTKYINQLGKARAEIPMQRVQNFLDEAEDYKASITKAYNDVGKEVEIPSTPLNNILNTLEQKTVGSKLADTFIAKGLTESGGKAIGTGVGAALGSLVGHGGIGAIVGERALGPFFSSVMPALAGAMTKSPVSAEGFKAATDFSVAAAKGVKLLNQGTKAVFKAGSEVLPSALYPTKEDRDKLDERLQEYQKTPQTLMDARSKSQINKYLPAHDDALNSTIGLAVQYLNSLRPSKDKQSPLDSEPVMSSTQKATYNNALDLANQPLTILDKIKSGSVTPADIQVVSTIYPALMQSLKTKLTSEMINAVDNKEPIAYKTRMALSAFMGQPLDSTMQAMSIIAAQPVPPQPTPQQGGAPKGSKSSPALQKLPNMYQTPGQAREQRQQLRK
jgi:hypothetical protein